MRTWFQRLGLIACGLVVLAGLSGCRSKHREVRVHEEQRHGEVHEEPQGEMIVE